MLLYTKLHNHYYYYASNSVVLFVQTQLLVLYATWFRPDLQILKYE
jgi:hypothetical protein